MKKSLLVCVLCLCVAGVANAAITHDSALGGAGGNTVYVATDSETDWFASGGNLNADNLWGERTGFGENAEQIYEGWGLTETLPQIKTTIAVDPGVYDVWVNYVRFGASTANPGGNRAGITAGLSLDSLVTFDVATGDDSVVGGSVLTGFTNSDRVGLRGYLGSVAADANGDITIFVTGTLNTGEERIWYDGVSYESNNSASNPSPASGDQDVVVNAALSWGTGIGVDVATHLLYLSAPNDPNLVNVTAVPISADGSGSASYDPPGDLDRDSVYTWRVDEVLTDTSVIAGAVWSFETVPSTPVITSQPAVDTLADADTAVNLTVVALNPFTTDDTGMTYQWSHNGTPVGTTATLSIPSAQIADEGEYDCVVTIISNGATTQSDSGWLNVKRVVQYHAFENDLLDTNGTNDGSAFLLETYVGEDPNSFPATAAFDAGFDGVGQALSLDGDHYVNIGLSASPKAHASLEHGSVSCWVKTATDGTMAGVYNEDPGHYATGCQFSISGGQVRALIRDDDPTSLQNSAGNVSDDQWHYVVIAWQAGLGGGDMAVYIDGALVKTQTSTGQFDVFGDWQFDMLVGAGNSRGVPAELFTGLIDELKVYNYPLTAEGVAVAYGAYTGDDTCVYPPALDFTGPGPDDSDEDGVFDKDCVVDIYDFAYFASSWLECGLIPACL